MRPIYVKRGTGTIKIADARPGDVCHVCGTSDAVRFVLLHDTPETPGPSTGRPLYLRICDWCRAYLAAGVDPEIRGAVALTDPAVDVARGNG